MAKQSKQKRQGIPATVSELGKSVRRVFFLSKICDWAFQDLLFTGFSYTVIDRERIGLIRSASTGFKNELLRKLQALPDGSNVVRLVQVDLNEEKIKDLSYILELANIIGATPELIEDLENLAEIALKKQAEANDH